MNDLSGFAAREAGEPMRLKHLPGDLRDAIMQAMEVGAIPTIQRGGYLYHAETGERIGPTLVEVSGTRTTADDISDTCDQIRDMLLEKNRKYGDSALAHRVAGTLRRPRGHSDGQSTIGRAGPAASPLYRCGQLQ